MFFNQIGDFFFVVDIVSEAVVCHVAYELAFELQVVQCVLEVVQIHYNLLFLYRFLYLNQRYERKCNLYLVKSHK